MNTSSLFCRSLVALSAVAVLLPADAVAGQRKFVYSYEATTSPKGAIEFENWVTFKHGNDVEDSYDFRHELEFGVTDRLQLGFYLADWKYSDSQGSVYKDSGIEVIYNMTNPSTDFLGSGLYFEALVGEDLLKLEGKLLLQKNFGRWITAYNLVVEGEWEGDDLDERAGEFKQTLGVSYEVNPNFSVGVEAFHEIGLPEWEEAGDSIVFGGPNVSVRSGRFFVTAAALVQLTDLDDEPELHSRVIVGCDF